MSVTNTTTTTTTTFENSSHSFESCLENLGETMKESYVIDENGTPIDLTEEQLRDIQLTIDSAKERAKEAFEPLLAPLIAQVEKQQAEIKALREQIGSDQGKSISSSIKEPEDGELPTAAWLITNRKSKSGKAVTGYNCFTMYYMVKNKNGFPPKGTWELQNKAAWNALAKQVNTDLMSDASGDSGAASTTAANAKAVEVPQTKGKGTKVTAYNMYTIEFMQKNPGAGFPPKGSWAQVPKAEVARYQAQADALKAQRA